MRIPTDVYIMSAVIALTITVGLGRTGLALNGDLRRNGAGEAEADRDRQGDHGGHYVDVSW